MTTHNFAQRRLFRLGYAHGKRDMRRKLELELEALRAARDELRVALQDWRESVEARRAAESAVVDFYRNAYAQRKLGVSLH